MDPYLEARWGDMHASLTSYAREQIVPQLPADLYALIEEYLAVETKLSEPQTLRDILIYDRESGDRLVTVIEFLSPANKEGEDGRQMYRRKQQDFLEGGVNVVEIDLIREGGYVLIPPELSLPPDRRRPYRISVVRRWKRIQAEVYRIPLRERLPAIRIPLRAADPDAWLDLQPVLEKCYEIGRYARHIDYRGQPRPPLSPDDAAWADQLLKEKGLR
jgi:hypothetical protein